MPVITALCEGPPSIAPAMHSWRRAGAPIGPLEGCRLRHRSPIRHEDVRERLVETATAQPGEVPPPGHNLRCGMQRYPHVERPSGRRRMRRL